MSRRNGIIVTAEPRGTQKHGKVTGTPKPGVCMQIDISETVDSNNRFTYEVFTISDGVRPYSGVCVLLEDELQGRLMTTAYVTGDECQVYWPVAGEELNMICGDNAGTDTEDIAFGDPMMIDSGTGKLIPPSSEEIQPFQVLEAFTNISEDKLTWCLYNGY